MVIVVETGDFAADYLACCRWAHMGINKAQVKKEEKKEKKKDCP